MDHTTTLTHLEVLDVDGQAVQLGHLLDGRPTVLVFIRHFG